MEIKFLIPTGVVEVFKLRMFRSCLGKCQRDSDQELSENLVYENWQNALARNLFLILYFLF